MEKTTIKAVLRTHEQDGSLETLGTSLSDVLDTVRVVDIVFNGNLWVRQRPFYNTIKTYVVGLLDDRTVGDWVTEWDTEFDNVSTACL